MKNQHENPSFSRLLINNYLVMTLVMAIAIGIVQLLPNQILERAIVWYDYDGLSRALEGSSDDAITPALFEQYLSKNPALQIYDAEGKSIYVSPAAKSREMTSDLLKLIPSILDGPGANSFAYTGADGQPEYVVIIHSSDNQRDKFYRINRDYQVIDASEKDREYFTEQEMALLFDFESESSGLTKQAYTNDTGQQRWIVLDYPAFDEKAYNTAINWWQYSWTVLAGLYVLIVIASIIWLNRKTKSLLLPLSQSIKGLISQQPMQIEYRGPREFVELYDEFNQLSERLQLSEYERQKLDNNRSKMLTDISHDLKTPITVIQGYAQALTSQVIPTDQQEKYLHTIYQKSVHLNRLIDTFFEYAQLNHPHLILHKQSMDLLDFMQAYLAEKYQEVDLAGFGLEVEIPEDQSAFYSIDPLQFRRAFDNLISNVLKYNPPGTTIYFSIIPAEELRLTLADDGVGLLLHLREHLFEPFSVGDEARGHAGGTGLGLPITQRIIELHDGTIELINPPQPPYKTQFLIRFPRETEE